jgi:FMN phosphatase YigB (HAD superfamily)
MKKSNKRKIVFLDIDYTLFNTDIFKKSNLKEYKNYDEVKKVLESLSKKLDLGIFSEGEKNLQEKKLENTGIKKYFNKNDIYILQGKNLSIKKIFKKHEKGSIFLVDDKLPILSEVKALCSFVFTVWIKRGAYAKKQKSIKGFTPDAKIKDLSGLENIIK